MRSGGIVSPVEVGLVCWSGDHTQVILGEPALEHGEVVLGLGSPFEPTFFKAVLTDTEADKFTILHVV